MKIETRCFFEAAHRLVDYKGKCQRIHGHNWIVDISIDTNKIDKTGFVVDFNKINEIVEEFDHKLILKICDENEKIAKSIPEDWINWVTFNPTCELFAHHFKNKLVNVFSLYQKDVHVKVYETYKPETKSFASV